MSSLNWPEAIPTLTDGDVTLRAWAAADAEAIFAACQDPVMQHSIPIPVPYLAEHARGFIENFAPSSGPAGSVHRSRPWTQSPETE